MNYKRLEIYVGWTCNQRCTYCVEFANMEEAWTKRVLARDILKTLLTYRKQGYNHVTYLGGEPFIQPVFLEALKIGKMLGYTILVTTNASTLHIEKQAGKFLPYIDELFLSVQAIDQITQQKISQTQGFARWEEVFRNIERFWKGTFLKTNIVITKDNLHLLGEIVEYLRKKGVINISITYPDIRYGYYSLEHIQQKIAPTYTECMREILPILTYGKKHGLHIKLPDFPFCIFPHDTVEQYIPYTDDYDYDARIKISHEGNLLDRTGLKEKPRIRCHSKKCEPCIYQSQCWGHSEYYDMLYGLGEITPIL